MIPSPLVETIYAWPSGILYCHRRGPNVRPDSTPPCCLLDPVQLHNQAYIRHSLLFRGWAAKQHLMGSNPEAQKTAEKIDWHQKTFFTERWWLGTPCILNELRWLAFWQSLNLEWFILWRGYVVVSSHCKYVMLL